jgi:hypothetical protein
MLEMLAGGAEDQNIQENVYGLLQWFSYKLEKEAGSSEAQNIRGLLSDKRIFDALWNAATARQLSARAIARLRSFPDTVAQLGVTLKLPSWWDTGVQNIAPAATQTTEIKNELVE